METILIVEDDRLLQKTLAYNLSAEGYAVQTASTYQEALAQWRARLFDLVLLDIKLPDGSGLTLCEDMRRSRQQTRIIFITANDTEADMLAGYSAGGYDYVTKPFSVTVLCRKIAAIFAEGGWQSPRRQLFDDGHLHLDFSSQTAALDGAPLALTPKEYRILALFVSHPRMILSKRQIFEQIWDVDGDFVDEHTLATIISRIRKKIESGGHAYIKTAYGIGYQWLGGERP